VQSMKYDKKSSQFTLVYVSVKSGQVQKSKCEMWRREMWRRDPQCLI